MDKVSDAVSRIDRDEDLSDDEKKSQAVSVSKEFQENVVKFVKVDDLIKKKQEELSELKDKKKACEKFILKYLDDVGENVIDITNGKLKKNKTESKTPINQDIMKKAISEKISDPTVIEEILKSMEDKRTTNTNVSLKRTGRKPRG